MGSVSVRSADQKIPWTAALDEIRVSNKVGDVVVEVTSQSQISASMVIGQLTDL